METDDSQDQECLLQIAAGGDARRQGVAALYERYQSRFVRYFLKNRVPKHVAEDIAQDTFVKIVRSCDNFRQETKVAVWLWTIARNCLYDHFRSAGRKPMLVDVTGPDPDGGRSLATTQSNVDVLEDCVQTAFQRFALQEPERAETLRLATIEGFTTAELASVIERTAGATREYLSQCRKALRPFLEPCQVYLTTE